MNGTRSLVSNGGVILYGVIDPSDPSGIRAIDVIDSLTEIADAPFVLARINSPGGSVIEGLAIYNALRGCGKPVTVQVDGVAASAASIVAMAGDKIVMAENATIMVHDPWALAMGTSDALRKSADEIDRLKAIMIGIYAGRTGLDPDEVTALMSAETFMSAGDAIDRGFADEVMQELKVAACATLDPSTMAHLLLAKSTVRAKAPITAAPPAKPKEKAMTTSAESGVPGGKKPAVAVHVHTGAPPVPVVTEAAPDLLAIRAEATKNERERVHGISHAIRAAKLDAAFGDEMIRAGTPLTEVHAKIIDKWAEVQAARSDNPPGGERPSGAEVIKDGADKWAEGVTQGIMMRAGMIKADRSNEFAGLTLSEVARESLKVLNIKTGGMNRMDMVGRAFTVRAEGPGFNSTSDFPTILQNVAFKSMMRGYTEADETFDKWTGKGTLSDFRPAYRVDSGLFPALDKIDEGAEYKYGTLTDSGTQVVLATYGKMFAITRQAIINDDLHYFDRVPMKMGRAAKRTIGNLVYAILNTNPLMQDGAALFSTAHGNLWAGGVAPIASTLSAARVAMARQKDDAGLSTGVGIVPKYILLPPELVDPFTTVLKAEYLTGDAGLQPNYVKNAAEPISDNRLSAGSWFLVADAALTDTIEVDYLDGNEEPFMDQRQGWTVDGAEFKVRIDAGVKALHWRGLYKNPTA